MPLFERRLRHAFVAWWTLASGCAATAMRAPPAAAVTPSLPAITAQLRLTSSLGWQRAPGARDKSAGKAMTMAATAKAARALGQGRLQWAAAADLRAGARWLQLTASPAAPDHLGVYGVTVGHMTSRHAAMLRLDRRGQRMAARLGASVATQARQLSVVLLAAGRGQRASPRLLLVFATQPGRRRGGLSVQLSGWSCAPTAVAAKRTAPLGAKSRTRARAAWTNSATSHAPRLAVSSPSAATGLSLRLGWRWRPPVHPRQLTASLALRAANPCSRRFRGDLTWSGARQRIRLSGRWSLSCAARTTHAGGLQPQSKAPGKRRNSARMARPRVAADAAQLALSVGWAPALPLQLAVSTALQRQQRRLTLTLSWRFGRQQTRGRLLLAAAGDLYRATRPRSRTPRASAGRLLAGLLVPLPFARYARTSGHLSLEGRLHLGAVHDATWAVRLAVVWRLQLG